MQSALNNPEMAEMNEITPAQVALLGREWLDFLVDTTPEKELSAIPKLELLLVQRGQAERQEGEQIGEAKILTRLLQRRFGAIPEWALAKITTANPASLEAWSLRLLDVHSLEDIFVEKE